MMGVKLNVEEMSLKPLNNLYEHTRALGYETVKEYNLCEYYFKIFSLTFAKVLDKNGIDCREQKKTLLEKQPTSISYLSDGSYLHLDWETHTMTIGSLYSNKKVKRYDLHRK